MASPILERAVKRSVALRQHYYRIINAGIEPVLGPPASEAEIAEFEKRLGIQLPPSYRDLLSICNGFRHWEGDTHLLSLDEMLTGPYAEWIVRWKIEAAARGDYLIAGGLVIGARLEANTGYVLNLDEREESNEVPIVNWEVAEIARYPDFYTLFDEDAEDWQAIIEDESV